MKKIKDLTVISVIAAMLVFGVSSYLLEYHCHDASRLWAANDSYGNLANAGLRERLEKDANPGNVSGNESGLNSSQFQVVNPKYAMETAESPTPFITPYMTVTPKWTPTRSPFRPTPTRTAPPPATPVPQGILSGRVLDAVTREGLCQAVIDIYRVWNSNVKYDSTTTDELGFYIRKLQSGNYKLVISMPNYVTITEYTVVSGGKTTLDPLLYAVPTGCHKKGTVSGVITSKVDGRGVRGLTMAFREGINAKEGPVLATETTGPGGKYRVKLPAGNYTAEISGTYSGYFNVVSVADKKAFNWNCAVTPVFTDEPLRIVLDSAANDPFALGGELNGSDIYGNCFWVCYSNPDYQGIHMDPQYPPGPKTLTIPHPALIKKAVYSIQCFTNSEVPNELGDLSPVVRVYRGDTLIAVFNPPSQPGNFWRVFSIEAGGIVRINRISYRKSPVYHWGRDLDGDGLMESVINEQYDPGGYESLSVMDDDGTVHDYDLPRGWRIANNRIGSWQHDGYADTDGKPGEEIIVEVIDPETAGSPCRIFIIHDRTRTVTQYDFGTAPYSFSLLKASDLDGEAGDELVFSRYEDPQTNTNLFRVLSDKQHGFRDYLFTNSQLSSIADLDGKPGEELYICRYDETYPYQKIHTIISYRDNSLHHYTLESNWRDWHVFDCDGRPGNEIVFCRGGGIEMLPDGAHLITVYVPRPPFAIICDAEGKVIY